MPDMIALISPCVLEISSIVHLSLRQWTREQQTTSSGFLRNPEKWIPALPKLTNAERAEDHAQSSFPPAVADPQGMEPPWERLRLPSRAWGTAGGLWLGPGSFLLD